MSAAFAPPLIVSVPARRIDIVKLEEQAPLWPPGTAHGYHARTFGFLLDELVRRFDTAQQPERTAPNP